MKKQTKVLLGLALLGTGAYLYYKSTGEKKSFVTAPKKQMCCPYGYWSIGTEVVGGQTYAKCTNDNSGLHSTICSLGTSSITA